MLVRRIWGLNSALMIGRQKGKPRTGEIMEFFLMALPILSLSEAGTATRRPLSAPTIPRSTGKNGQNSNRRRGSALAAVVVGQPVVMGVRLGFPESGGMPFE